MVKVNSLPDCWEVYEIIVFVIFFLGGGESYMKLRLYFIEAKSHKHIHLSIYLFIIFIQDSPFTKWWSSMGP